MGTVDGFGPLVLNCIDLRADRIRPRVDRLWTCFGGRPNWSLADVGAAENAVAAA